MSDSFENIVLDVLANHAQLDRDKVTASTPLDNIGVDSLLMVEIIFDLEEKFDISIPDPDFIGQQGPQFKTAGDVVRIAKEILEEQQNTP
jgi:acyl carrier protein